MAGRSSQDPRTVLEYLLHQQDRTYEEIVREFDKMARRLDERGVSISPRHLRRLAAGERVGTTPATRRLLQAFFNMPISDLLKPWSPEEATSTTRNSVAADSMPTETELLTMAAERSREFALKWQLSTTGEAIDQIADEVRELVLIYPTQPLPTILGRLVGAQGVLLSMLDLRQKPADARRLYFLATVVSGLLAYAGSDVGKPQIALHHARMAFMWAEYADYNGLR